MNEVKGRAATEADASKQARAQRNWGAIIGGILMALLIGSVVFAAIRLAQVPSVSHELDVRVKSDYVLMILQCLLGIAVWFLPMVVERRFAIKVPGAMEVAFFLFLFCAIYLGEVRNFYFRVPFWDTVLHAFSGAMLGALGFILVALLNNSRRLQMELTPFFVSFFAFCFAVTAGTVWEIYEFTGDALLGTNMQKYMTYDGEVLVGHAALGDTMKDLIVDSIAALVVVTLGYFSVRRRWHEDEVAELLDRERYRLPR